MHAKSQALSLGLHAAALALLLFVTSHSVLSPTPAAVPRRIIRLAPLPRPAWNRTEPRAGGSNQTLLPARHGAPPPKALAIFIPPKSQPDPKLAVPVTVAFDSLRVEIDASRIGDPLSKLRVGELGSHGRGGIGDQGCCGGIGPGDQGRPGISAGFGHKITPPQLLYKVEPEFSEEARRAKFSGEVILAIQVGTDGRARGFRVLESPGMGLDQKAIDAVMQWRFRPGLEDGKPVVTSATVQVNFRLL